MIWKRLRTALLVGALVAATGSIRAEEDKAKGDKPAHTPAPVDVAKPAEPCPATTTVYVNEWVPEQYETTRTTYRVEERQEAYTAYKTECVPEVRTRTVTHYRTVSETVMEPRTKCVEVPYCEERTVTKTRKRLRCVSESKRVCEDQGHYECRQVPCGPSLMDRFRGLCKKDDCCDPCEPVRMKTEKVWVPNKVWVEKPVTRLRWVTECYTDVVKENKVRKEMHTEMVPVTRCKKIPECKTETFTVMVSKCVPYPATRCVKVCVPHTEKVTCTRMVCRKVAKEVPVVPACETSCCEPTPCCEPACTPCCESKKGFFSRLCGR